MIERNGHHPGYHPDREPHREINRVQRLNLELMGLASFNNCDGHRVAADLEANPDLWRAAIVGNFGKSAELLALRDMEQGFYNADTLMVLTDDEHAPTVEEMAWRWDAHEVGWLSEEVTAEKLGVSPTAGRKVLRVYWD